jgi:hypothetical protein
MIYPEHDFPNVSMDYQYGYSIQFQNSFSINEFMYSCLLYILVFVGYNGHALYVNLNMKGDISFYMNF